MRSPPLTTTDVSNNYYDANKDGTLNGSPLCANSSCYGGLDVVTTPFAHPPPSTVLSAPDALAWVITNAGSNHPSRDTVDTRLLQEVQSFGKLGQLISDERGSPMNGPGIVAGGTKPLDSDGDGIPDDWEAAHDLDPKDVRDGMQIGKDGYAHLEAYLNSLVKNAI